MDGTNLAALGRRISRRTARSLRHFASFAPRRSADSDRSCVYCKKRVNSWLPYNNGLSDLSPVILRLQIVGSNVERFNCPHCGSHDRERHLRLYFDRLGLWSLLADANVLHIAPEKNLSEVIEASGSALYVRGDLYPVDETVQKIDLENVKFPNDTFNFIICNHVLEHVADLSTVLSEVHRVLKPGGRFVCQTPYAARLSRRFEDPLLQAEFDRIFFYGQDDHVRLFGRDIEQTIREAGFKGRLTPHSELLPDIDPERAGVNENEPFFDFVRV